MSKYKPLPTVKLIHYKIALLNVYRYCLKQLGYELFGQAYSFVSKSFSFDLFSFDSPVRYLFEIHPILKGSHNKFNQPLKMQAMPSSNRYVKDSVLTKR